MTPTEVRVSENGNVLGRQDVYAHYAPDSFAIPITLAKGRQILTIEWLDGDRVLATRTLAIQRKGGGNDH